AIAFPELAGVVTACHVEQADECQCGSTVCGRQAAIEQEGGQVQRDEGGMEATDRIAPEQEMKRSMSQGLAHRAAERLRIAPFFGLAGEEGRQGNTDSHEK